MLTVGNSSAYTTWEFGLCSASNFHSFTFFPLAGVGRTAPDPSASVTLDGVQVPLGKGAHTNIDDTSLLYNEYPLTLISWFMNLMIILPNHPTCFQLFYIIGYLVVSRKGQSQDFLSTYFIAINRYTDKRDKGQDFGIRSVLVFASTGFGCMQVKRPVWRAKEAKRIG